jgi:creatinine amidohydrolase
MTVRSWVHLTAADFSSVDRENALVLMPFGATEQHGPHLPVGTDSLLVEEVLRRVTPRIQDLEVLVLPTLWCTKSNEHISFVSSLYLEAETLMAMVHDIAAAVSRSGFKRLVLMNWHGGNSDLLAAMGRDLRQRHQLLVFIIDIVRSFLNPMRDVSKPQVDYDIHAGQYETGLMLAAYPDLVRPGPYQGIGSDLERGGLADSFKGRRYMLPEGGAVYVAWETRDLAPDGVVGDPSKADPVKGGRDLGFMVDRVEAILREVATFEFRLNL